MTLERPTWPSQLRERASAMDYVTVEQCFLGTIAPLDIPENTTHGSIMVIGQSQAFPERALICTPNSKFTELKPGVSRLVCCDPEFFSDPKRHLTDYMDDDTVENAVPVEYFPWGALPVLKELPPESFDSVFAFQILDLTKQLEGGLLTEIARTLKAGGYFIGSGGVEGRFYESIAELSGGRLRVVHQVNLPNPSYQGYPFKEHIGVVLQRS